MSELINWFGADWRSQTRSKVKFFAQPHTTLCIQFLDREKQQQKQYIAIGKTDLFNYGMGLCGNFTAFELRLRVDSFVQENERTCYQLSP